MRQQPPRAPAALGSKWPYLVSRNIYLLRVIISAALLVIDKEKYMLSTMPHDFLEVILQGLHLQILTDNYATKLIRVIIIMIIVNVSIPTSGLIKLWCVC